MRNIRTLDSRDARAAIDAGMAEAQARGLAMAFAVVDNAGDLIACMRMENVPARVLRHATRKAFTAAEMSRNTRSFHQDLIDRGGNLDQWGNRELTTLQGGLVALDNGEVVGGVGCGGGPLDDDEAVAREMLRAMGIAPVIDPRG